MLHPFVHLLSRFFLACLLALSLPALAQVKVWVVMSGEDGVYAETANVLRNELEREASLKFGLAARLLNTQEPLPALIVTVGTAAFDATQQWLAERSALYAHLPLLATLLPRSAYDTRMAETTRSGRIMSAVLLDQPIGRQMALIRRALPDWTRVGILPGPQTRAQLSVLERQARIRDLRLVVGPPVDNAEQVYPALKEVLASADVLLALPEPLIYSSANLQNILLASYRARVPMAAFSPAYVKAGALLAVYTTPTQLARQTAVTIRSFLSGRGMPAAQLPREFDVVINHHVAASLGLRIDEAARIVEDLRREETKQ